MIWSWQNHSRPAIFSQPGVAIRSFYHVFAMIPKRFRQKFIARPSYMSQKLLRKASTKIFINMFSRENRKLYSLSVERFSALWAALVKPLIVCLILVRYYCIDRYMHGFFSDGTYNGCLALCFCTINYFTSFSSIKITRINQRYNNYTW